jgi:cytochrome P450
MEEIDGILGPGTELSLTMKDLNEMKYLECCIKESLRLYPSVPVIGRQIKEDATVGRHNTHCLVAKHEGLNISSNLTTAALHLIIN